MQYDHLMWTGNRKKNGQLWLQQISYMDQFYFLPEKLGAHPISQFRLPNNVGSKRLLEIFNNLAQSSFELFKFHENSKDDFQLKIA